MGSTLKVEPENRKKKNLPDELKFTLRKRNHGSCISNFRMDESDLSYLKGLVDCEIPGAYELIEFIEKYESVILDEEF